MSLVSAGSQVRAAVDGKFSASVSKCAVNSIALRTLELEVSSIKDKSHSKLKQAEPESPDKSFLERLRHIEPVLHLLTFIVVAYGIFALQTHRDSFEEDQRTVEITSHIADSWEQWFDPATRYRFYRFSDELWSLRDKPDEMRKMAQIIADEHSLIVYNDKNLPNDPELVTFINSDKMEVSGGFSAKLSANRSAVIKGLNAMETLAVILKFTKNENTKSIIKLTHGDQVILRSKQLRPFVEEYNKVMTAKNGAKYEGWGALLEAEAILKSAK